MTVIVGDNTEKKRLFSQLHVLMVDHLTHLDDCGNVNAGITNGGAMVGASYDFGNGLLQL